MLARRVATVFLLTGTAALGQAQGRTVTSPGCRSVTLTGEVQAGEPFSRPIGDGLQFSLHPVHSGWIVRVAPVAEPSKDPDYAEVATPPYRSVTPLSVSTDFAFRAQDAVGWNPREFRFAVSRSAYTEFLELYQETAVTAPGAPMPVSGARLGQLLAGTGSGRMRILDARLVPGMADQWSAAAAVASHFSSTAHTLQEPPDGRASPLGQLRWIRFQVDLLMPGAHAVDGKPVTGCSF